MSKSARCLRAWRESKRGDVPSAGGGFIPSVLRPSNACAVQSVARRGAGSWRSGGVDALHSYGGPMSEFGSGRAEKLGVGRVVTRHPRRIRRRSYSEKFNRPWTTLSRCHAPASNEDCPGFWLDRLRESGQNLEHRRRCHAPPAMCNSRALLGISWLFVDSMSRATLGNARCPWLPSRPWPTPSPRVFSPARPSLRRWRRSKQSCRWRGRRYSPSTRYFAWTLTLAMSRRLFVKRAASCDESPQFKPR